MAIVNSNLARPAAHADIARRWRDEPIAWLSPSRSLSCAELMRRLLAFGLPFSVGASAGFASRRWDNLIISALFGPG